MSVFSATFKVLPTANLSRSFMSNAISRSASAVVLRHVIGGDGIGFGIDAHAPVGAGDDHVLEVPVFDFLDAVGLADDPLVVFGDAVVGDHGDVGEVVTPVEAGGGRLHVRPGDLQSHQRE